MRSVAVVQRGQRGHVRHPRAHDRIRLVFHEALERRASCLRVPVEQLAQGSVAPRVARFVASRVRPQVRVEAAGAVLPLAVEHPQVRHEEGRACRPRRLRKAVLHVLVAADGLLVAVRAREGTRGVEGILGGVCPSDARALRVRLRGVAIATAGGVERHGPRTRALEVGDLVGTGRSGDEIDRAQRVVRSAGVGEHARAHHQLLRGQRMPWFELGDQRDRIRGRRHVRPLDGEPSSVRPLGISGRIGEPYPKRARLSLLRAGPPVAREDAVGGSTPPPSVLGLLERPRRVELRARPAACRRRRRAAGASPPTRRAAGGRPLHLRGPARHASARSAPRVATCPRPATPRARATRRPTARRARAKAKEWPAPRRGRAIPRTPRPRPRPWRSGAPGPGARPCGRKPRGARPRRPSSAAQVQTW